MRTWTVAFFLCLSAGVFAQGENITEKFNPEIALVQGSEVITNIQLTASEASKLTGIKLMNSDQKVWRFNIMLLNPATNKAHTHMIYGSRFPKEVLTALDELGGNTRISFSDFYIGDIAARDIAVPKNQFWVLPEEE